VGSPFIYFTVTGILLNQQGQGGISFVGGERSDTHAMTTARYRIFDLLLVEDVLTVPVFTAALLPKTSVQHEPIE